MAILAQNGIGGEAIIWLIIAFFWVVAQLATRAKEKAARRRLDQTPPAQRPQGQQEEQPNEAGFEQEMRRFFESLGADVVEEEEEKPAPATVQRRPPARATPRREPEPPPIHIVARQEEPRPVVLLDPTIGEMDTRIDESVLDTDKAYALTEHHYDESMNAFVNPRTLLVNLNYLRMNMPRIPVDELSTTSETRPRPVMHSRKALRDALTMQIILSNPLAMGEDKASYTKRVV